MLQEKEERKRKRLLERGFKPPQAPDEEGEAPPPDPEIEEDPEDFDKANNEKSLLNQLLRAEDATVFDLEWFDIPEDGPSAVVTPIADLLFESRRPPEIVVELKVSQQKMLERLLDKDGIQAQFDMLAEKRAEEKRVLREEDRAKKLEELKENEEKT